MIQYNVVMKKYFIFFIFLYLIFTPTVFALESTTGFIPGQIWYSKEPLVEGDMVDIHTAVWNGEKDPVSAKIEFYDKNVILGSRDIILSSLELKDVYIPWKITSGDHVISAKIISSLVTVLGKKENVVLSRITTSDNKQFVPVIVKNNIGEPVSEADMLKNQINQTTSEINNIVPEKISAPILNVLSTVDNLRDKTLTQVNAVVDETKKEISQVLGASTIVSKNPNNDKVGNIQDVVKKPIAYIKLFLFSTLSFIFGNKIVFYGILAVIIFYLIRFIFRKVRNK